MIAADLIIAIKLLSMLVHEQSDLVGYMLAVIKLAKDVTVFFLFK